MIENILAKRENESEFEHHKRLVYGKLKDKTLADYDYGEISQYLYGREYASDETRKRMYGSLSTLELMDKVGVQSITDFDLLNELDSKRIELQKERQRFFDQRREFNKLVNAEGRKEHIYEKIVEAAEKLPDVMSPIDADVSNRFIEYGDSSAVLCLADWHYGMVADNVFNKYNTDICKDRVMRITREAMDRIALHKCRKLTIVVLGDLLSGAIHTGVRVASEELVADQLMQVSELVAQVVLILSQCVEELDVYMTYGNHARTVQNKKDSVHRDNMERIVLWWLRERVAAEAAVFEPAQRINVREESDYEFLVFDSSGFTFCASHGDLDSVKSSPKQLGMLLHKTLGCDISYCLLADKHHSESYEDMGIEAMMCGSLCGSDEYASNKRLYSKPSQLLLITNPRDGVDAKYELRCDF